MEPIPDHGADTCVRCGGLWFEAGELARAIRAHDPAAVPPSPIAESVVGSPGPSQHHCPVCRSPLRVHRLSESNPVRVEVCGDCSGVWLPHGELARVQAGHQLPEARAAIDAERGWGDWCFQFLMGLPVEFSVQPRRDPLVTKGLIALNVLVFVVGWFWTSQNGSELFLNLSLHPSRLGQAQWYGSLLSSQFLHANLIHLLGNMYFLWVCGDNVEDLFGRVWFLVFYLITGVVAGVVYTLLTFPSDLPAVGASGAVSGVLGAYAVLFRGSRLTFMLTIWQFKLSAPLYIGIWAVFNVLGWLNGSPGVAWEAHLGGLLFGVGVGLAAYRPLLRHRPLLRLLNGTTAPRTGGEL